MADNKSTDPLSERLQSFLEFLDSDPDNADLLRDTIEIALSEGRDDIVESLLQTHVGSEPKSDAHIAVLGFVAMRQKQFDLAAEHYETLNTINPPDAAVRFNMAWCKAMLKQFEAALDLLDEATVTSLPQAAMLETQILHQLGQFEEAMVRAKVHMKTHPENQGLLSAVSVLAMDVEDEDLALECAHKGGDHPDALATLATLTLGDDNNKEALSLFNKALDINTHNPRAWVGKGLAELSLGATKIAAQNIDHGANMFKTHLGSWIAAGWAYFVMEDLETSRARFEHALALDDTFAETHGSLAALDVIEGNIDSAREKTKIALRLDKECFSAALAQTLLLNSRGNPEAAQKIFNRTINTPINDSGRTIAQSLSRLGLKS